MFELVGILVFFYLFIKSGAFFMLFALLTCGPAPPPIDFKLPRPLRKRGGSFSVLVLGGSGAIGKSLVQVLVKCKQVKSIRLILRQKLELNLPKVEQRIVNFDELNSEIFEGADIAFYAIGACSGLVSLEEYLKVEEENAIKLAKLMRAGGVKEIHWVTAIGAWDKSPFLFGRVKAKVEAVLKNLGFERVVIYRPGGVLTSDNSGVFGKDRIILNRYLDPFRIWTVEGDALAKVMVENSLRDSKNKVEIWKNRLINKFSKRYLNI